MKRTMKMKVVQSMLMFTMVVASSYSALAQCREFIWPEERDKAEEKVALYGDAMKQKNYQAAEAPHHWMLVHAPNWHVKLYIDGADLYDNLAEKEKDPTRKRALVDSMLLMYDLRLQYCGDEVNVLNRKAYYAYKYNVNNKDKVADLLKLFDHVADISGEKMSDGLLVAYMQVVQANKMMLNALTDEQILDRYDKISTIMDAKIKNAKDDASRQKLVDSKNAIDNLLIGMVKVDCDFVKTNLEPKFRKDPTDITLTKKIFSFMLQGKCTDDPLWLEAAEAIYKQEKDFGLAKNLALKYMAADNNEKAEYYLNEALTLAKDGSDKASIYIYLGSLQAKKGSKSAAREAFRQAIAADPSNKEGFEKIGDLYYGSFNDCAKQTSMAEDRLVYLAAYEMYARAGERQKMAQAKAQFPSKEEIFLLNWKTGETQHVGCWIGENVTIDTRD